MATDLAEELKHLESRLASENERLSHEWTGAGKLPPRITSEVVQQLAPQSRAIEATEQMLAAAKHELELHRNGHDEYTTQIETAMTAGDRLGLPKDIEAAGDLVAQLRRRQHLEQKIESAQNQAEELQSQARDLVDEQVVSLGLFMLLGTVFTLGVVGIAAWGFLPTTMVGKYGPWLAGIGIASSVIAFLVKFLRETHAFDRFDSVQHEIESTLDHLEDAEAEQDELDHSLSLNGGSVALRLQHAERHLAELERILPVESQRREAEQEISAAERRFKLAEEKYAAALTNWKSRLRALGLPEDASPGNLSTMAGQCERLGELEAKIDNRRDDLLRRERDFAVISQRIVALADETALRKEKVSPLEQLDHLRIEYDRHMQRVEQRAAIRAKGKALRVESGKHRHAALGYRRRRETLFQTCGVADEQELRQLAAKLEEAEELRKKRAAVTREITAAIGKHGTEADYAPFLADDQIGRIESDWESLSTQSEELDRALKDALQRRGAMVEQQRTAASDQLLSVKQIELDVVQQQIKKATDAWRERAAVSMFLERIREEYEQNRQPETLREASNYMSQLTGGRYTRIWTPLAHDILFVDTAEGQPLSVQVLSRGTREQLFVSLRLALVSAYGRRGIHLPMILDDVFVNFDAGRTRTACSVLRDFAKQGHQLLVFTCHEHVWQMFKEIKVDCRRIPNRHGKLDEEVPETAQPEPVPERAPEPVPETVVVQAPVEVAPTPAPEPTPPPPKRIKAKPRPKPIAVQAPVEEAEQDVLAEPVEPEPSLYEVEYWWDSASSEGSNGVRRFHDETPSGWLSESEFRPPRH
jgi:uncharacterized protein YhaN